MMMTEMDIETSVYYVHLTRLIAREDYIKFTRRESTKTYIVLWIVTPSRLHPEDVGSMVLRIVGILPQHHSSVTIQKTSTLKS
jgi:hypothetical protein